MIRTWARCMSRKWQRDFRRNGFDILNSFSIDCQAAEKKYQIKKMKKVLGLSKEPEKPLKVVEKLEDVPHIDYARETIKKLMAKLEKEHGPFTFEIIESPDKNPFNSKIKMNEKAYEALWKEIIKDPENIPKVVRPLEAALAFGVNILHPSMSSGTQSVPSSPDAPDVVPPEIAEKAKLYADEMEKIVTSTDLYRLDIGLIVNRPPIFLHQTDMEMQWHKYRYQFMNEYYLDLREIQKDIEDLVPTREEYVKEVINRDQFDTDQQPTHRMRNPDGTYSYYYAASKHYTRIDPNVTDRHSLHYAPNHRVYLLVKNKDTKEWEFPMQVLRQRQTLQNAKDSLFEKISSKQWSIAHYSTVPLMTTMRDFTKEEKEEFRQALLQGIRTFYFLAYHKSGIPTVDKNLYEDFAWVPKREINQFLPRDSFNEFKESLWDT